MRLGEPTIEAGCITCVKIIDVYKTLRKELKSGNLHCNECDTPLRPMSEFKLFLREKPPSITPARKPVTPPKMGRGIRDKSS